MCYADKRLKLCTCGTEIDKSKPHWILRTEQGFKLDTIMGMFLFEEDSTPRSKLEQWILEELKNHECFDFDYRSYHNDTLEINVKSERLYFTYNEMRHSWEYSDGDLTEQKERVLHGKVVERDKFVLLQTSTFKEDSTPTSISGIGSVGYIYLGYDSEKPGMCKVGCTTREVGQRLSETTNPHYRFYNSYQLANVDIKLVEQGVHQYIATNGIERIIHGTGKLSEWFREDKETLDSIVLDYLKERYDEKLLNGLTHEEALELAEEKAAFKKEKEKAIDDEINRIEKRVRDITPVLESIRIAYDESVTKIYNAITRSHNPEEKNHWLREVAPMVVACVPVLMFFADNPTAALVIGGIVYWIMKPKADEYIIPNEAIKIATKRFTDETGYLKVKSLSEAIKTFNERVYYPSDAPIKNPFFSVQLTAKELDDIKIALKNWEALTLK